MLEYSSPAYVGFGGISPGIMSACGIALIQALPISNSCLWTRLD